MKKIVFYIAGLVALLVVSCDMDLSDSGQYFEYDLRGTWRSTGSYNFYRELIIEYSNITFNGYNIYWVADNIFKDITPGVSLKGYSVKGETIDKSSRKGEIFIYDRNSLQEGIPYLYWENYTDDYKKQKFLTFNFGSNFETLKYVNEDD